MKASVLLKSFNAGEWSPWLEGRTDIVKYPASLRRAYNTFLTPQGPAMRRPGTAMQAPVYDESKQSYLIPFVFSDDQAQQVEFADLRIRFHDEDGLLAYTPVAITVVANVTGVARFTAAGHATVVGEQVVLAGFGFDTNLNARIGRVTVVAGNDVTTDIPYVTPGALTTATLARVYHIASTYTEADVVTLRYVSDDDTIYLFCDGKPVRKLQRFGAYDWRLSDAVFKDGPYGPTNEETTKLTPSVNTGNVVPIMTAANAPSGVASGSTETGGSEFWRAFDNSRATYWQPTTNQNANLNYEFAVATVVDGYVIERAKVNTDVNYSANDYAPGDFTFEGSPDGVTWTVLDRKIGYVVYDGGRSLYFDIKNDVAYLHYKLDITKGTRNGALTPRVARLLMSSPTSPAVTFTANAVTGINDGQGFLATDVGRLLRFKGKDGMWRPFKIVTRTSTTVVTATAEGDPLTDFSPTTEWRLGLFSDTTGHPTCGCFFEDRLVLGGMSGVPDTVVASVTGKYETMSQTEADGTVNDDNALVLKLSARKQGRVAWIATDGRSLLVGTTAGEWAISSVEANAALSARTAKARRATVRGSAAVEPVQVDKQVLFVQHSNKTLREMAYRFEDDGYRTTSMSLYASHMGAPNFLQLDIGYEPHALVFARRGDGLVAAFTYNREEDVIGWQILDFNGFVESISVIPSADGSQDALWLIVRRTVGGVERRFIERMTRFWDFISVLTDAHFVDCGVVYNGAAISVVYGLYQYEGQLLCGLADGSPITPQVVVDGRITLPDGVTASKIVLGVGYDSEFEPSRLDAGGTDGTAQGKMKRVHEMKLRLWQSGGGQYAVRDADGAVSELMAIDYLDPQTVLDEAPPLFTGDTGKLDTPAHWSTEGSIVLRQPKETPLPFNVVAIMATLVTNV